MKLKERLTEGEMRVDGKTLHHSGFNAEWLQQLEIVPKVIVDVGSYDFGDAIRFKQQYKDADVYSFELDSRNFLRHSEFAKQRGVIVENIGVSDTNNLAEGYYQSHHAAGVNAQSTLLKPTEKYTSAYSYVKHIYVESQIQQTRLDNYFPPNIDIDLLHVDVEGAEYKVLLGLGELRPKLIWLEYLIDGGWEGCNFIDVDTWLVDHGYTLELHAGYDKLWRKNNA